MAFFIFIVYLILEHYICLLFTTYPYIFNLAFDCRIIQVNVILAHVSDEYWNVLWLYMRLYTDQP